MNNHGFIQVAAAMPELRVGDCVYNAARMREMIDRANDQGAQVLVFPELSITSYTCGDLFLHQSLLDSAMEALDTLREHTERSDVLVFAGVPVRHENALYNCAVALQSGNILGVVPKRYIPNHGAFGEKRYFTSGSLARGNSVTICCVQVPFSQNLIFESGGVNIAVEIGADMWAPMPVSAAHCLAGADLICNLSANAELAGQHDKLRAMVRRQSAALHCGYICVSPGCGESTTDLMFRAHALFAEDGGIIKCARAQGRESLLALAQIDIQKLHLLRMRNTLWTDARAGLPEYTRVPFKLRSTQVQLTREIDPSPFIPRDEEKRAQRAKEIFHIQSGALAKRLEHTRTKKIVLGISGGLDSTWALLVAAECTDLLNLPRSGIIAVTMPGFGTTGRTRQNALSLAQALQCESRTVDITDACLQHFKDIGHDPDAHNVTFENAQARERTQILMDIANIEGALALGTGDLSELALGWATYNGDHMSMYGVNAGVPKTLMRCLVRWYADHAGRDVSIILEDVLATPVSPELLPAKDGEIAQRTENILGPYEIHDFILYYFMRYGFAPEKILMLLRHAFKDAYTEEQCAAWLKLFFDRFFSQQFKRSCSPDGPKIGSIGLSPRGDLRMPSDGHGPQL